jgi:hypothetical protein
MNKMILLLMMFSVFIVSPVSAGNILFVSDDNSDNNIPAALSADGHSVTVSSNRSVLSGNLSGYCAVYWSASDDGEDNLSGVISNLTNYVTSGGHVFVTGADSVASPVNIDMLNFVGGSDGKDAGNILGPIINVINSLTYGVIDIRNQTPPNISDADTLCTPLLPGTIGVSASDSTQCTGYEWTLRTLGNGEVAWVSSGNFENQSNDPNWTSTAIPGDGVFNAGLRNFAYNSCRSNVAVPTMNQWGLIIFFILAGIGTIYYIRRQRIVER